MRKAEIAVIFLAAVLCLGITVWLFGLVATNQPIFPLPGLYFIEMGLLTLGALFCVLGDIPHVEKILWAIAGIFLGFVLLGLWSVGLAYVPIFVLLLVDAIVITARRKANFLWGLGFALAGVFMQVVLIVSMLPMSS